jgi:hypothetical protein
MKLFFFQTFLIFVLCTGNVVSQPFLPKYEVTAVLDTAKNTVSGKCTVQFRTDLSEVTFHAWANAFRSKTTPFAETFLEDHDNTFYFYDNKTDLGGYKVMLVKSNGVDITIDHTQEILKIPLPANGKDEHIVEIEFTLVLPKKISILGWNKNQISLHAWYPTLALHDGKKWTESPYLPFLVLPEAMGVHSINLTVPENYCVLFDNLVAKEGFPSTVKMRTEGKSPVFRIVHKELITTNIYKNNTELSYSNLKETNLNDKPERVENALIFLEKYFGYSGIKHFINPAGKKKNKFPDVALINTHLLHLLYNHYNAADNQHYFFNALKRYILVQYVESNGKTLKNSEQIIALFDNKANDDEIDKYFDLNGRTDYYFSKRYDTGFPDCCFHTISNNTIRHLESYLGEEETFNIITHYLKDHFHQEISFEGLFHYASQKSGKDVLPIFLSYSAKNNRADYFFTNYKVDDDSITVEIENRTGNIVPFPLHLLTKDGSKQLWLDGFSGSRTFSFSKKYDYEYIKNIVIDRNLIVREISRKNNRLKINPDKNTAYLRNIHFFTKKTNSHPIFGYSYSDKFLFGYNIYNFRYSKVKGIYYHVMPMYSLSANKILGEASLGYNFIPRSGPQSIRFELSLKSFDRFYQKKLDYRERYIKIQPAFIINFTEPVLNTKSELVFRTILLWEEEGQFSNDGKYTGNTYKPSAVFRTDYTFRKGHNLGDREFRAGLEFQSYTPVFAEKNSHYLKTNMTASREFYYKADKLVNARFYASAFLLNTEKSSTSFNPVFTRGSVSLLHQGFNDYLYDEYYTIRQNQKQGLAQQVSSREGGGFKHAFGSGQNIGMSNRFACSVNFMADLPFNGFNALKIFFDSGVYGNADGKTSFLYSGGLAFYLDPDEYFRIYYPLVMSKDLNNLHGGKLFTWTKLSFAADINSIMLK